MTLAPMLKEDGRLIGDFTLANSVPRGIWSSVRAWRRNITCAGSSSTCRTTAPWSSRRGDLAGGLAIAGPRSRELLASVTRRISRAAASSLMDIRRCPSAWLRARGPGQLHGRSRLRVLVRSRLPSPSVRYADVGGRQLGHPNCSDRAPQSLRLEKGYGSWAREYRPIYSPSKQDSTASSRWARRPIHRQEAAARRAGWRPPAAACFVVEADTPTPSAMNRSGMEAGVRMGDLGRLRPSRRCFGRHGLCPKEVAAAMTAGASRSWDALSGAVAAAALFDPEGRRMRS